jgi:hypothetical protein
MFRGVARGCAKGARAHPLEEKWLEGSTGLKNDPQGRQVFPLAGTPLGTFLATPLDLICSTCDLPMSGFLKRRNKMYKKINLETFSSIRIIFSHTTLSYNVGLTFSFYLGYRHIRLRANNHGQTYSTLFVHIDIQHDDDDDDENIIHTQL